MGVDGDWHPSVPTGRHHVLGSSRTVEIVVERDRFVRVHLGEHLPVSDRPSPTSIHLPMSREVRERLSPSLSPTPSVCVRTRRTPLDDEQKPPLLAQGI